MHIEIENYRKGQNGDGLSSIPLHVSVSLETKNVQIMHKNVYAMGVDIKKASWRKPTKPGALAGGNQQSLAHWLEETNKA